MSPDAAGDLRFLLLKLLVSTAPSVSSDSNCSRRVAQAFCTLRMITHGYIGHVVINDSC